MQMYVGNVLGCGPARENQYLCSIMTADILLVCVDMYEYIYILSYMYVKADTYRGTLSFLYDRSSPPPPDFCMIDHPSPPPDSCMIDHPSPLIR